MVDLDRNEKGIDIHHIFPKKWCQEANISPRVGKQSISPSTGSSDNGFEIEDDED
jgi:hypothetical protein